MSTNRVLFLSTLVLALGVPSMSAGVESPVAAADSGITADSEIPAEAEVPADAAIPADTGTPADAATPADAEGTGDPEITRIPGSAARPEVTVETAADYGDGCVIYPDNRAATIDSLRFRCSAEQQDLIFHNSGIGNVPMGVTNGWVTRPPIMESLAPPFWLGKNFYTGPEGGTLMNRLTGAGIEGWQADVYAAPAIADGQPAWALNYAPSPTPPVYDEIREITPGVWFGYSWWRGAFQTTLLLTFVLTHP